MQALYFGTYERTYPRNAQVVAALRRSGVEVLERHEPVWEGERFAFRAGGRAAVRLARAELRLARPLLLRPDVVIVGYPGHADLLCARRAARGRPVVFNPLVSLWDTFVEDRGRFGPRSLAGRVLLAADRAALRAADLVVSDTDAGARHLATLGGLAPSRVRTCFVGAEERLFRPGWRGGGPVLFVGKLIPLHGVATILAAARLAPDLPFRLVGSGQEQHLLRDLPANVEWLPWRPYERLPEELHQARCALGIFGTSRKAARVIPNKGFQALACGTPLITGDTPGARELLCHGESALLVQPGQPQALVAALRQLDADPGLAARLAAGGLAAYRTRASEEVLGLRWRRLLEEVV